MLREGKPATFRLFPIGSYVVIYSAGSFLPTLVGSPTTRPLDFRFLLKSSLGCFPSAHMAKLLLADLLKFGLRFFELGFLLAKVSFSPSAPNLAGQFLPNLRWTDSTGCNGLEKPGRLLLRAEAHGPNDS